MLKILIITISLIPLSVFAIEEDEIAKEVADNVSSEFATCAAYFAIVSEAVSRSGDKDISNQYKSIQETAMSYALISAKVGRTDEMAQKVSLARFSMFLQGMGEDMGKDISNISILSNKYAFTCKNAMEKPEKLMEDIQNKVVQKYTEKKR